ncbi:hypothetical protein A3D03_03990 [Candidatus Gottesmanbacteria bacterium RIFCSPHIGHO2_02_FULL_40_13]|uniref:Type 4 fimbrial biogenesis protein PilX N-terminal domain-containing protein n=1 Tax=Candidatus Gottesmanbacteria bacterium RIFCSPHIGHO2_02_FULL_40_13 TaxID=1798384 RepID=A0A1F6A8F5_9BACT|nr:MAG: hypothetical protein A3D03_03990 [Candidatus Gottesmanbacteria bacterium RIFCSPHIGHO2_02_FULL_40_13]
MIMKIQITPPKADQPLAENFKFQINRKNYITRDKSAGQIVLILVLITVVGLTIGLSLISRSVTDVRISSQIEESSRAFSAAEAGVENALKIINVFPTDTPQSITLDNASAEYTVSDIGGSNSLYSFPATEANSSQILWLVNHDSDGGLGIAYYSKTDSLDICWGIAGNNAAIEFSLYYKTGSTYKIAKSAYDPDISRAGNNKFNPADTDGSYCESIYPYKHTINFITDFGVSEADNLLALRMTPVYENTAIGVKPTENLPVQGNQINSVGKTTTGVVRKIQVNKTYSILPGLLDFALYCESNCQ